MARRDGVCVEEPGQFIQAVIILGDFFRFLQPIFLRKIRKTRGAQLFSFLLFDSGQRFRQHIPGIEASPVTGKRIRSQPEKPFRGIKVSIAAGFQKRSISSFVHDLRLKEVHQELFAIKGDQDPGGGASRQFVKQRSSMIARLHIQAQARCGEDAQTIPSGVHGGEQGDELLLLRYNGMAG